MRAAAVHERGCQDRDPVVARSDLCSYRRPLGHERFTVHQLENKNERIHEDDKNGDDGKACRTPGRIA